MALFFLVFKLLNVIKKSNCMSEITKTRETICNRKPSCQTPIFKGFEPVFGLKSYQFVYTIFSSKKSPNQWVFGRKASRSDYLHFSCSAHARIYTKSVTLPLCDRLRRSQIWRQSSYLA